jgi:fucose permease
VFQTKPRNILIIACSMFLVFGMFNAAIGPALGELAEQTGSTLAAVGAVITFLFLGSLVTQLAAGPLTDRFGQKPLLVISLLLVAVCLPAFTNARSLPLMLTLVFFTGMGQGGLDLGANLIVSSAYPKNNTSVLNLLHFFFGLGAIVGPAVVSLTLVTLGSGLIVHWFAAAVFFAIGVIVFTIRESKPDHSPQTDDQNATISSAKSVYLSPILWLVCIMILVYVGVEYGSGSWATSYMASTTGLAKENGALVTSAYWAALTLGRLGGAALGSRVTRIRLLIAAVLVSLVGAALLVLGRGVVSLSTIAFILLGLSYGTIYPTSVGVMVAAFPGHQGKAVGLLTAMGSIGGLSLPWLAGVLLEKVSPLAFTLFMVAGGLIMLALLVITGRLLKKGAVA